MFLWHFKTISGSKSCSMHHNLAIKWHYNFLWSQGLFKKKQKSVFKANFLFLWKFSMVTKSEISPQCNLGYLWNFRFKFIGKCVTNKTAIVTTCTRGINLSVQVLKICDITLTDAILEHPLTTKHSVLQKWMSADYSEQVLMIMPESNDGQIEF